MGQTGSGAEKGTAHTRDGVVHQIQYLKTRQDLSAERGRRAEIGDIIALQTQGVHFVVQAGGDLGQARIAAVHVLLTVAPKAVAFRANLTFTPGCQSDGKE